MDEIIQDTEQQPTTQPADNGDQGSERMFTQAEVNQIIKERLARERAKAVPQEPTEAELREKNLVARESRLTCKEYLDFMKYPMELLDILDTSDHKEFTKKADAVQRVVDKTVRETFESRSFRAHQIPEPHKSTEHLGGGTVDGFRNTKHTPRQYPFAYDE